VKGPRRTLRVHPTVPLLLALAAVFGQGYAALIWVLSLALHELAHLMAAEACRLEVQEVRIYPTGGAAVLSALVDAPWLAECAVALAGPVQSLAVAGLLHLGEGVWPADPLDGGRVLRALWARSRGYRRSLRAALALSQILAGLALLVGVGALLAGYPALGWLGAGATLLVVARAEAREAFLPVAGGLFTRARLLREEGVLRTVRLAARPDLTVRELLRHFFPRRWHEVVLLDEELQVRGRVSEASIQAALRQGELERPLSDLGEEP
jgi:stage IV sporulation protein FB